MVSTLIPPNISRMNRPGSGPTPASAMGKARMPAPAVSVKVREKAVQKGDRDSRRRSNEVQTKPSRSFGDGRSA